MEYVITIITSVVVSVIASNVIAAYHFKVIDGYVRSIVEQAASCMKKTADALDKLQ